MPGLASDSDGRTAFHGAAAAGQPKAMAKMIAQLSKKALGSALLQRDSRGRTPAHTAAYHGQLRTLRLLLDACPDAGNVRDSDGNSVFDVLRSEEHWQSSHEGELAFQHLVSWGSNLGGQLAQPSHGGPGHHKISASYCSGINVDAGGVRSVSLSANSLVVVTESGEVWVAGQGRSAPALTLVPEINGAVATSTSSRNTLVVTADTCWTWGTNRLGILGYECSSKVQKEPRKFEHDLPEFAFRAEVAGNAFDALGSSDTPRQPVEPLLGGAVCDTHVAVFSSSKLWSWGQNSRGQMMAGRNNHVGSVVPEPVLVMANTRKRLGGSIQSVHVSAELGTVVTLDSGGVYILADEQATQVLTGARQVAVAGAFIVAHQDDRLTRFHKSGGSLTRVWTPRRPKDQILAFDVAEDGSVVLATHAGVYIWSGNKPTEVPGLGGLRLSMLRCDAYANAFVGVQEFWVRQPSLEWPEHNLAVPIDGSLIMEAQDGSEITARAEVALGRCPELQSRPGACKRLRFADMSPESVGAFAEYLRTDTRTPSLRGLDVFVRRSLAAGIWESRGLEIATDVQLQGRDGHRLAAHRWVLAQKSDFFRARFDRWASSGNVVVLEWDTTVLERILHYIYVGETALNPPVESPVQFVFDVWQASSELLVDGLGDVCERTLLQSLDFSLVVPFVVALPVRSALREVLLDVLVNNMDWFIAEIGDLDARSLDTVERRFRSEIGTEIIPESEVTKLLALPVNSPSPRRASELEPQRESPKEKQRSPSTKSKPLPVAHNLADATTPANQGPSTLPKVGAPAAVAATPTLNDSEATDSGPWMPARRKSRPSSSGPRPLLVPPTTTSPVSVPKTRVGSSPSPSNTASAIKSVPSTPTPPGTSSRPVVSTAGLPTLGTKPQQRASSATKHPRPKFSQKDRRNMTSLEDPLTPPHSAPRPTVGSSSGSPWRQVEQPTSSQAIVEQLTRRTRLQGAWATGGGW